MTTTTPPLPEGVPPAAWSAIGAKPEGGDWIIPEYNSAGEIVGHAIRRADGAKRFKPNEHRGLTLDWPLNTYAGTTAADPILIVEGASCTAAGMGLGFDVVGRPSCTGGVQHLRPLVKGLHICIVAENDQKRGSNGKPGHWPGRDGARRVAAELVAECASVRIIFPPKQHKDLRAWIIGCATGADVENAITNAAPFTITPAAPTATTPNPSPADRERMRKMVRASSTDELLECLDATTDSALANTPADVHSDAAAMLSDPRLIDRVLADLEAIGVVGEHDLAATCYVVGTSRLLRKPLAGIVQGPSGTGKTFVPLTTAKLFPPEAVLNTTDFTTNALYYLPPGALMHRWIVAGEQRRGEDDEHADTRKALREMLESGSLSKMVPMKAGNGGSQMETQIIQQSGPIAFTESTTKVKLFDEDANRCLLLGTDESEDQTKRIVRAQAARAAGKGTDPSPIIARHHALQRMLRRVRVVIPFAETLAAAIPTERQEARRAMPHMLSMIEAVALLHQRQRATGELHHGDTIIAAPVDYVIARRLLIGPLGRTLGGALPEAVTRFGERLSRYGSDIFTSSDALRDDQVLSSKGKVNEYLRALEGVGSVECVGESKGNKPATWKVSGPVPIGGALWLPTVDAIREVSQ